MDLDIKVVVPGNLATHFNEKAQSKDDRYHTSDIIQVLSNELMSSLVPEQLALQQSVLDVLPANQDVLHVRTKEDFETVLASQNSAVIMVRAKETGKLIAQSIALLPDRQNPDADMIDMKLPGKSESLSTLCSVISHPEARGKNLMRVMIDSWFDIMKKLNRRHALAVITSDNVRSWACFLNKGLLITGAGHDPADGSTVYYAHRDLKKTIHTSCDAANDNKQYPPQEMIISPHLKLSEMKRIFNQGWVGHRAESQIGSKKYTQRLILAKKKFILSPK